MMIDNIKGEMIKVSPSAGGTGLTIWLAKFNHLDWATIAAQSTVAYTVLMGLYLLWKWRREATAK